MAGGPFGGEGRMDLGAAEPGAPGVWCFYNPVRSPGWGEPIKKVEITEQFRWLSPTDIIRQIGELRTSRLHVKLSGLELRNYPVATKRSFDLADCPSRLWQSQLQTGIQDIMWRQLKFVRRTRHDFHKNAERNLRGD
ncbi:hypothetical protein Bbelb_336280 [Branchiostoma belcheri]|nr:hypothetical protein Bbelb_336280 [Branchiostoma belcheri]